MTGSAVRHLNPAQWLRRIPLFRAGPRDAQPLVIGNRRIYVLPTGFGLFIGMALAVLNLGSLNYNNNAALLLGFLVISLCNNALISGHLALLGLQLRSQPPEPVFAGQPLALTVMVSPRGTEPRDYTVSQGDTESTFSLGAEPISTTLSLPTEKRGHLHIDRLRIATLHPLGLARAWCTLNLQEQALVYPSPQGQDLNVYFSSAETGSGRQSRQHSEQPHHLRTYRSGDSRKQIAWKPSARTGTLQVREYEQGNADALLLDWNRLGNLEYEARISQLCLWVVQAEQRQRRYALSLPGLRVETGSGAEHRRRCLEALALLPHD
ncbi:DUF58 domain-containing protein [Arenimonas sp. GDDSR-1]|uniref:DUF58 domain-containing protein n=1 Tax=Arenimonas sp. GDDSR-1 TaxID=2950125 RepID=UPI002619BEC0|nr:DUF58 domain-containing protein [Arenimonas sp. GDDSR-1]